jgi:hypothetical protein
LALDPGSNILVLDSLSRVPAADRLISRLVVLRGVSRDLSLYGKEVKRQKEWLANIEKVPELVG